MAEQLDPVVLVPYDIDPLEILVDRLLTNHADILPLLTHVTVLLPDLQAAPRLRRLLLEKSAKLNFSALLGPRIMALDDWISQRPPPERTVISDPSRELMLVDALREHHTLFSGGSPWTLAESLLELFDDLTQNSIGLPTDLEDFTRRVAEGYGSQEVWPEPLAREARLVHTLWHAWHEQLSARGVIDRNSARLLSLAQRMEVNTSEQLYVAGFSSFSRAELEWLRLMLGDRRLWLFLQGEPGEVAVDAYHPDSAIADLLQQLGLLSQATGRPPSPISHFLNSVYCSDPENEPALGERARAMVTTFPTSPLSGALNFLHAGSAEDEARAVEIQVRRWLIEGRKNIAVITENRRLARRIRALLERAGIILQDSGGWALSTTSAAAALERWLQCVEEDFPHLAMLDLLKSPFFCSDEQRNEHLEDIYRLEQSLILQENIGSGMQRYRFALATRRHRLPDSMAPSMKRIDALLQKLADAATGLVPLTGSSPQPPLRFIEAVQQSLALLGMDGNLESDAAGYRLLEVLREMGAAITCDNQPMGWTEFRGWLGRTLEHANFHPSSSGQQVELMGLGQSRLGRYDALIIAAVERDYLPGGSGHSPFFNDAVRQQLGLPTSVETARQRFYHFRRLLQAAPRVLLTLRSEQDGEEVLPSPWLENLLTFHQLAYNDDLEERELAALIRQPWSQIVNRDQPLPQTGGYPSPSVEPSLIPAVLSASGYQTLLDCPYQFYAARCLGLAPPEAIREALEKSDYGEKVHRCLEAFHHNVCGLPGPFEGALSSVGRDEAVALLEQIARAEFARDLEDNFLHRDWLQRWYQLIPVYIDWQITRTEQWQVSEVEQRAEQSHLVEGITLRGRIDRIDEGREGLSIIDYKTGAIPNRDEVLSGESIQLPFYRLLASERPVTRVEYLSLNNEVKTRLILEGEELQALSQDVAGRLAELNQQLHNGNGLPAWGDEQSCEYCPMEGVCRKQSWEENGSR